MGLRQAAEKCMSLCTWFFLIIISKPIIITILCTQQSAVTIIIILKKPSIDIFMRELKIYKE